MKTQLFFILLCLPMLLVSQKEATFESRYKQANDLHQQALFTDSKAICEEFLPQLKNTQLRIDFLILYAENLRMLNHEEEALIALNDAYKLFSSKKAKKEIRYLKLLNTQAKVYYYLADCQNMKRVLEEALLLFEGQTTDNELAVTYDYLGSYWGDMGELEKAVLYFNKAKNIRLINKKNDPLPLFQSSIYLALAESFNLNHDEAIRILLEGVDIVDQNNGNYYNKSTILFAIASKFDYKQDYDTAIRYLEESLLLLDEHQKDASSLKADILSSLGGVYQNKTDYEKSEPYFLEALSLLTFNDHRRGLYLHDYALLQAYMGNFEKAEASLIQASDILSASNNQCGWYIIQLMQVQKTLASLYFHKKEYQKAIDAHLKTIEEIKTALGSKSIELLQAYNNIGLAYKDIGQYEKAEFYYDEGIELAGGIKASTLDFSYLFGAFEWSYLIWNKAENYLIKYKEDEQIDYLKKALYLFDLSVKFVDYQRRSFRDEASKISFAAINKVVYEACIDAILKWQKIAPNKERYESAFEYFEKSRALVLLEAFNERNVTEFNEISADLLEKEAQIRAASQNAENDYFYSLNKYGEEDDRTITAKSLRFNTKKSYNDFLIKLKNEHKDYYETKYEPNIRSLDEIRQSLIEDDSTCLLEYYVSEDNVYMCYVSKTQFEIIKIEKDDSLWTERIKHLTNSIIAYYKAPGNQRSDQEYGKQLSLYLESATQLYDDLINPFQERGLFDGMKKIIIVPDEQLTNIPFEILLKGMPETVSNFDTYPFLIRDFQFSYAYSASLSLEMKHKKTIFTKNKQILALAPFANQKSKQFEQLPFSKEESIELATQLWNGTYRLNEQATKEFFIEQCPNFNILHLSTHATANVQTGVDSYLAFSPLGKDGLLYARELYKLNVNAELIVLSACETNMGEWNSGEGMISIGRGFAYAGAKSIVTTFWRVDEIPSKNLTLGFYRYLKQDGMTKDAALRLSKLDILNGPHNSRKHPFFWSSMIAIGDMSPISK